MSSVRGAYKGKLREGTSLATRRKSRGNERKTSRNNEINKRRPLAVDMSPVLEMFDFDDDSTEANTNTSKPKDKRGQKAENVLDRLKKWREVKKQRLEQEKLTSKPVFRVGGQLHEHGLQLYGAGAKLMKVGKENKAVITKLPVKQAPERTNKIGNCTAITQKITNDTNKAKFDNKTTSKLEVKKLVPVRKRIPNNNEPLPAAAKSGSRLQRSTTTDLSSKLTAAAAAKRNDINSSPKKFLRATRGTTLKKKEQPIEASSKKGVKGLKGASKSTGNLKTNKTMVISNVKTVEAPQNVMPLFEPVEVPKILEDFNFASLNAARVDDPFNPLQEIETQAKFDNIGPLVATNSPLKRNRKSVRRSIRLDAVKINDIADIAPASEHADDLIILTPIQSKRKSVHQFKQVEVGPQEDRFDDFITFTPSQSLRKNLRRSKRLSSSVTKNNLNLIPLPIGTDMPNKFSDDLIAFCPGLSSVKKNLRKSTRLSSSVAKQFNTNCNSDRVNGIGADDHSLTPKLVKRKSTRKSKPMSELFEDLQASGDDETQIEDNVLSVLPLSEPYTEIDLKPKKNDDSKTRMRKSCRKSLAEDSSNDQSMELGPAEIDFNTAECLTPGKVRQIPFTEVTTTPKSSRQEEPLGSCKRKSLVDVLSASSIEQTTSTPNKVIKTQSSHSKRRHSQRRSTVSRRQSRKSPGIPVRTPSQFISTNSMDGNELNISCTSTPNSVKNIENIPRLSISRRNARKSSVIDVSDEGTAVGRDLELAHDAYKVEKPHLSAKASRILNELVIEKVDGEQSFFEVSFDESMRENKSDSFNFTGSKCGSTSSDDKFMSTSTSPFTPRKSHEVSSQASSSSSPFVTPKSACRTRHTMAPSSDFKEPGLPLSALRKSGSRRKTTSSRTPEQMINILRNSPMIEMTRRRSRHVTCPADDSPPPKGQYFRDLITNETNRLNILGNKWNDIMSQQEGLNEDVLGQIRAAVGKALLLIDQRFKQFSGLVDNHVYGLGEKETTETDLQGFWDMIYFQVEDINANFQHLDQLKQSNWQVKSNTPKAVVGTKKNVRTKVKPKGPKVKSNFAGFIAEMKKRKAAEAALTQTAME